MPVVDPKRAADVVVSAALLAGLSPLMAVIAVAVKLSSPGPVLFSQERVGRHGVSFRVHKFRSMCSAHDGVAVSPTGDPRITRVGRLLRETKLDELPQLFDVLVGNMSVVGPRPEVLQWVDKWPPHERELILSVRPGISDPVSVWLRDEADLLAQAPDPVEFYEQVLLPQKVAGYVDYVRNQSLAGDFRVVVDTIMSVLRLR